MSDHEPRHDAPICQLEHCEGGVLVPIAYQDGMTRPRLSIGTGHGFQALLTMLTCTDCNIVRAGHQTEVLQAWWSVGAAEQHRADVMRDEPFIGRLREVYGDLLNEIDREASWRHDNQHESPEQPGLCDCRQCTLHRISDALWSALLVSTPAAPAPQSPHPGGTEA